MSEDTGSLTIRFDSTEVSDIEVAAVTVAVATLTGAGGGDAGTGTGGQGSIGPAWRVAALREATDGQRIGTRVALRGALGSVG